MGNFYTSLTLRTSEREKVVQVMQGREAFVSPVSNGYTMVWDKECETQDQRILSKVAQELATNVGCCVLAIMNHDDDILWYELHSPEGKLDEYNSCPGYFDGGDATPSGGDVELLTRNMRPDAPKELIERILRDTKFAFAYERHFELIQALGLPQFGVASGFEYIDGGESPEGLEESDLIRTH